MPMLTMSVIVLPVWPFHAPSRTRSVKSRIFASTRVDLGHHVLAVDEDRPVRAVAQRDVQHGAVLGAVDLLAGEHLVAPALDVGLLREREQQLQRLVGGAVLRVVDEQAARLARQLREPLRILREQLAHRRLRDLVACASRGPARRARW